MIHCGPPLTAHVKANDRFFLHLAVRCDGVTDNAPCWARQHGPGATELLHGGQAAVGLHEQDVNILEGARINGKPNGLLPERRDADGFT